MPQEGLAPSVSGLQIRRSAISASGAKMVEKDGNAPSSCPYEGPVLLLNYISEYIKLFIS